MQSNFNDIMKDGEAEGNNDSFEATSQEVATGRTDIKELASESDEDGQFRITFLYMSLSE